VGDVADRAARTQGRAASGVGPVRPDGQRVAVRSGAGKAVGHVRHPMAARM
jgi:hypothetical protein